MKKGFAGDEKRDDKERCGSLYDQVSPADRVALYHGFGSSLADHYANSNDYEFNWDNAAREEADRALPKLMRLI